MSTNKSNAPTSDPPYTGNDEILAVEQMYQADSRTIEAGTPGETLMENAGTACAHAIENQWLPRKTVILCGPGNNGGDGFVIARLLQEKGWPVRLALLGAREKLTGDAAIMANKWQGPIEPLSLDVLNKVELIVDALFGAGLARPIEGKIAELIATINESNVPVAAIDLPSGIDGNSGAVLGIAPRCDLTITFARKKQGHVLAPGRFYCGEIIVADIGIPDDVIDILGIECFENSPNLWATTFPTLDPLGHKYARGHSLVVSGGASATGAARLAAMGALRVGSGLVTVASPPSALLVNASHLTTIMVQSLDGVTGLETLLSDERKNAFVIGPGAGVNERTKENVLTILKTGRAVVLDADAITSFQDAPDQLLAACHDNTVLTPHEGEFVRLFPDLDDAYGDKITRVRQAAKRAGAVVLLKGPDTTIADPSGRVSVNTNATPVLGTAGSGDVLAGLICGLMAQSMPAFDAACAAAWIHGECGKVLGRGLIGEDLPDAVPDVLQVLDGLGEG